MLLGKDKLKTVAKKGVLQAVLGGTEAGKLTFKVKLPGKVAKRLKLPRLIGTQHGRPDQGHHRQAAGQADQEGRQEVRQGHQGGPHRRQGPAASTRPATPARPPPGSTRVEAGSHTLAGVPSSPGETAL